MKKEKYPRLIAEMEKKKETRKDIAMLIKKDPSQVSRRLKGEIGWTIPEAKKLVRHYKVNFLKLFEEGE